MVVTIEPISYENYLNVLALKASKELVAPNSESLAEAYLSLKKAADSNEINLGCMEMPYAILKDKTVIGFLMFAFEDGEDIFSDDGNIYWLSRFMIDEKYQGKGFGKAALLKLIDFIKTKPDGNEANRFMLLLCPMILVPLRTSFMRVLVLKKLGVCLKMRK